MSPLNSLEQRNEGSIVNPFRVANDQVTAEPEKFSGKTIAVLFPNGEEGIVASAQNPDLLREIMKQEQPGQKYARLTLPLLQEVPELLNKSRGEISEILQ